jgi:hypothetical protein
MAHRSAWATPPRLGGKGRVNPVANMFANKKPLQPFWRGSFVREVWSRHSDLNRGPAVYETAALPLSYVGADPE